MRIRSGLIKKVKKEVTKRLKDLLQQNSMDSNCYLELLMEEENQEVGGDRLKKVCPPSPETDILDVFEKVGGQLLILGQPGSGKTITLLQLAKALLEKAEEDDKAPFPVIFELATWKDDLDIEQWLVYRLKENYSIDKKVSKKWIETNQLLPLLDGLDELGNILLQRKCIEKINKFSNNLQRRLVVCCRWEEYQAAKYKLNKLSGAYRLLSLSDLEIKNYLDKFQKYALWNAISTSNKMQDFAQKPLFLNMMMTAYQGSNFKNEAQLWKNYIEERFLVDIKEYHKGLPYSPKDTKIWLGHLARILEGESTPDFLIENISYYWLQTTLEKRKFKFIYNICLGLLVTVSGGSVVLALFASQFLSQFFLSKTFGVKKFIEFMIYLIVLLSFDAILGSLLDPITNQLIKNIIAGLFYTLFLMCFQLDYQYKFNLEKFDISLKTIIKGIVSGTLFGNNFALILLIILYNIINPILSFISPILQDIFNREFITGYGQQGLIYIAFIRIVFMFIGSIFGVIYFSKVEIKVKEIPNQGIKKTLKNTLSIFGLSSFLGILFFSGLVFALSGSFASIEYVDEGLLIGILIALVTGGRDCLIHLILRGVLFYSGKIPRDYADFLKFAVDRKFIQQVGGRYRFLHNSLQKYFADNL